MVRYTPKLSVSVLYPSLIYNQNATFQKPVEFPSAGATNEPNNWAAGHDTSSFELLKPKNIKGRYALLSIDIITFFINILAGEIVKRISE